MTSLPPRKNVHKVPARRVQLTGVQPKGHGRNSLRLLAYDRNMSTRPLPQTSEVSLFGLRGAVLEVKAIAFDSSHRGPLWQLLSRATVDTRRNVSQAQGLGALWGKATEHNAFPRQARPLVWRCYSPASVLRGGQVRRGSGEGQELPFLPQTFSQGTKLSVERVFL